jgi:hypothetical protein
LLTQGALRKLLFVVSIAVTSQTCDGQTPVASLSHEDLDETKGSQPLNGFEQVRNFRKDSVFYKASTPVGYVVVDTYGGGQDFCTGTVIDKDALLTARHCLNNKVGKRLQIRDIRFWPQDTHSEGGTPYHLAAQPLDEGKGDQDDFVVLRFTTSIDTSGMQIPSIGGDPVDQQALYIYHEPFGQPFTLTRLNCWAIRGTDDGVELHHHCDTDNSSSGAPIMNENFQLVGIHLAGGLSPDDISSWNRGLLLSEILTKSNRVHVALNRDHPAPTSDDSQVTVPPATVSFSNAQGDKFELKKNIWFYQPHLQGAQQIRLKAQEGTSNAYVLWNPTNDTLIELPADGGMQRVRAASAAATGWTDVGQISRDQVQ